MQSLDSQLVNEQHQIENLVGTSGGTQFFIVQAPDEETALQREEILIAKLQPLVITKALSGFQSPSQYVPSAKRQRENLVLTRQLYDKYLAKQSAALNLKIAPVYSANQQILALAEARQKGNLPFLNILMLDDKSAVTHAVMLDRINDLNAVAEAGKNIEGVRLVDPAGDFSVLLAKYRNRAVVLMVLSTLFMFPILVWRYGFIGAIWVKLPAVIAVLLTPFIASAFGLAFTFFDAMALLLVLSIGVDYAVFCAESSGMRKPVTMIGVAMSACTALLSFGLLGFSQMLAVHNFGFTMLIGILLAFLLAPIAQKGNLE